MSKRSVRHPTRKELSNPTYTPPFISCGKGVIRLLRYLYENKNQRFNVKAYSKQNNIPRPTIYDYLNKLNSYDLLDRNLADNKITKKGIILLESSNTVSEGGVGSSRRECRKEANLSTHYHKFKLPISNKTLFNIEKLKKLNPLEIKENRIHNLNQVIIKFEDAIIFVNPKQLIINLYDVVTSDVDESDFRCISRAIEYAKLFISIGIITEGIIVEEGHWARVQSILSDLLYKIDKRYFLDLDNGRKFWIDHSIKNEDETNDKEAREQLDKALKQLMTENIDLTDINKIKEALGIVTQIEVKETSKMVELKEIMKASLIINKDTIAGLNAVVTYIKSQIPEKKEEIKQENYRIEYCG